MDEIIKQLAQYGIAGVALAVLFVLLKWMMNLHDRVMSDSKNEREAWQKLILSLNERMNDHTAQSKSFHDSVSEAHKFQREEHNGMIRLMGNISHNLERICNK